MEMQITRPRSAEPSSRVSAADDEGNVRVAGTRIEDGIPELGALSQLTKRKARRASAGAETGASMAGSSVQPRLTRADFARMSSLPPRQLSATESAAADAAAVEALVSDLQPERAVEIIPEAQQRVAKLTTALVQREESRVDGVQFAVDDLTLRTQSYADFESLKNLSPREMLSVMTNESQSNFLSKALNTRVGLAVRDVTSLAVVAGVGAMAVPAAAALWNHAVNRGALANLAGAGSVSVPFLASWFPGLQDSLVRSMTRLDSSSNLQRKSQVMARLFGASPHHLQLAKMIQESAPLINALIDFSGTDVAKADRALSVIRDYLDEGIFDGDESRGTIDAFYQALLTEFHATPDSPPEMSAMTDRTPLLTGIRSAFYGAGDRARRAPGDEFV